jgi:hypothetical protein
MRVAMTKVLMLLACLPGAARALDADAELKRLMQEQYGAYSARAKGWAFKHEGVAYVMKPISSKKIGTPYGERLYVFAAGNVANEKDGSHAATGLAGAFVLEEKDGKAGLAAGTKAMQYGSFGAAPDTVKLVQLGPDHYYGWIYESGYTGQGYTSSYNHVLAPRGTGVASLAAIPAHMDNEGAKPCDDKETRKECEVLDFELKIDASSAGAKVHPLLVTRSGVQAGSKTRPQTWRVPFDEKKWSYSVPAALKVQY